MSTAPQSVADAFIARLLQEHQNESDRAKGVRSRLADFGTWLHTGAPDMPLEKLQEAVTNLGKAVQQLAEAEHFATGFRAAADRQRPAIKAGSQPLPILPDNGAQGRTARDLSWVTSLLGKRVRIHWRDGGGIEGELAQVLRNEHGGEVALLVVKQADSEVGVDPDDVAAIDEARPDPDEPGPDRTVPDAAEPDRNTGGQLVATKGTVNTENGPVPAPKGGKK